MVFTYSGHGTQVSDASGDESDPYDEAIYLYDGTVKDDDLRIILDGIYPQATLVIISDSCSQGPLPGLRLKNGNRVSCRQRFQLRARWHAAPFSY